MHPAQVAPNDAAALANLEPRHYRRRERHSSPRTRRASQPKAFMSSRDATDKEEVSPASVMHTSRAWSSYSQADASISSAGGVIDEDDYSSSDTEVGTEGTIYDTLLVEEDLTRDEIVNANNLPLRGARLHDGFALSNRQIDPRNGYSLRSQSISGSVSTLIDQENEHQAGRSDHIATGFTLKERLGDAFAGVTRNRS